MFTETQVTESNAVTSFQLYTPERAVCLMMNLTKYDLHFKQKPDPKYIVLPAGCKQFYTWTLPADERRVSFYFSDDTISEADIEQDSVCKLSLFLYEKI